MSKWSRHALNEQLHSRVKLQSILKSTRPTTRYQESMYLTYPSLWSISALSSSFIIISSSLSLARSRYRFFFGLLDSIKSHKIIITMGKFCASKERRKITCTEESHHCSTWANHESMFVMCITVTGAARARGAGSDGGICAVHKCIIKIKCMMDCNYIYIVAV